jgi:predicted permease
MRKLRAFAIRLAAILLPHKASASNDDFSAEIESHIHLQIDEGIRNGLTEQQARREVMLRMGRVEHARQAYRERRTLPWLENLLEDSRYGLRSLRRSPAFALTAILTLALGIGACTAVFSLVNAVLIRSLPYGNPNQLVYLFTPNPQISVPREVMTPSYADFYDIQRRSHSFSNMTIFVQKSLRFASQGIVEKISAARVDENFFSTLESNPEVGRAIDADDDQPGHEKVVVISHSLWISNFAASPNVLTQSLVLDGSGYRIIGVMPQGFEYPSSSDLPYGDSSIKTTRLWIPLAKSAKEKAERDPGDDEVVARLKPGVSLDQAQAEMSTIMVQLDKLHNPEMRGWQAYIKSFPDTALGPVRGPMGMLLGAVGFVLLIACGNAANLLLARASSRVRELGVRVALGAGRIRIIRQLLTESLLIGAASGATGIALAALFLRLLPLLDPGNIPRLNQASLDLRVLAFILVLTLLTSVATGIVPALTVTRISLTSFLASGNSHGSSGGQSRLQSTLIVVESALVVVLLACAGLLIRSYIKVQSVDTGFAQATLTMNVELEPIQARPPGGRTVEFKSLINRIAALPGVNWVGAVNNLPLSNSESVGFFTVEGYANKKDQLVEGRSITPNYFKAMGIPLIKGRFFSNDGGPNDARVAIVNQKFASTYLANRNPIGARINTNEQHPDWTTVVGVVADVHHTGLEVEPEAQMYRSNFDFDDAALAVRTTLPPATIAAEIKSALQTSNPNLLITNIRTMGDLVTQASAQRRFQTSLLVVFAAIALALALVGLYGLMAYSVGRRTREVGIRMALGAQRADVVRLVLRSAGILLVSGLAAGLVGAWIATHAIKSFLFGVTEHDPATIACVCLLLAVSGFFAALIPARRAASIDPIQALRSE